MRTTEETTTANPIRAAGDRDADRSSPSPDNGGVSALFGDGDAVRTNNTANAVAEGDEDTLSFSDEPIDGLPEAHLLTIVGDVDIHVTPRLKAHLREVLLKTDARHLVIDMRNVPYIDSTGFGVLLGSVRTLKPNYGSVRLFGCVRSVSYLLEITRLITVLPVFATRAEALDSLRQEIQDTSLQS